MLFKILFLFCSIVFMFCGSCYPSTFDENLKILESKINDVKWISYSPSNCNPLKGEMPTKQSIQDDLEIILKNGFNGIFVSSSQYFFRELPLVARGLGFKGFIMGISDPNDEEQLKTALSMFDYIDGYCVGTNGLGVFYDAEILNRVVSLIRLGTNKPVTTCERLDSYYSNSDLIKLGDWVFASIEPAFKEVIDPVVSAKFIQSEYLRFKRFCKEKKILFSNIGLPTKGKLGASESAQKEYLNLIEKTTTKFVCFEAFDQSYKREIPSDPYWGIFSSQRVPKEYVRSRVTKEAE